MSLYNSESLLKTHFRKKKFDFIIKYTFLKIWKKNKKSVSYIVCNFIRLFLASLKFTP